MRFCSLFLLLSYFLNANGFHLALSASSTRPQFIAATNSPHSPTFSAATNHPLPPTYIARATSLNSVALTTSCFIVGSILGGCTGTPLVIKATKSWYNNIDLPAFTPPDAIFAPVWTVLYASMGLSASRIYLEYSFNLPLKLFTSHYILNLLWAPLFFGLKKIRLAHCLNYLLLSTLALTIKCFYSLNKLSSLLLLPYLIWLLFATRLNSKICEMNPTKNGYNNAMLEAGLIKLQNDARQRAGL
ncbi:hypothetical protein TrLO_g8189 [Triparma laevis f. longispina]|uniref:Uncharacterized protein n=1 Tax=Triparma laevis f. longispina TaxID=1714387 RepID=A0A9W6Z872_9STRA|nr:hypothetical protein TrLO_g8189 [Triparma laevis f. longispina]